MYQKVCPSAGSPRCSVWNQQSSGRHLFGVNPAHPAHLIPTKLNGIHIKCRDYKRYEEFSWIRAGNTHERSATCKATFVNDTATSPPILDLLANIVGWLVIAGSTVRSVPQIVRIAKNKSAEGLSPAAFVSELAAYFITFAYNVRFHYPISTWGETLTSSLQHCVLVGLIFHYNKVVGRPFKLASTAFLVVGTGYLFSDICTEATLKYLQSFVILILGFGGRLPQIILNWRRGNSGELSLISTALSVAGNAARVFTTIVLVKDPIIMLTAISQLILNGTLLLQIIDTMMNVKKLDAKVA